MTARTIDQWKEILAALPSPDGVPVSLLAAQRILDALISYRWHGKDRPNDTLQLANALEAWAQLVNLAGSSRTSG